jgi:hypothetical protein
VAPVRPPAHARAVAPVRPSAQARAVAVAAPRIPIVTLPHLGSLGYRCDSTGRRVAATLTGGPTALTGGSVTVEGDHRVHLRVPGTTTRTTPFGAYHSLTWRMILTNEPRTLVATVRLHFALSRRGAVGCSLTTWSVSGQVIEHDHKWSNPPEWP